MDGFLGLDELTEMVYDYRVQYPLLFSGAGVAPRSAARIILQKLDLDGNLLLDENEFSSWIRAGTSCRAHSAANFPPQASSIRLLHLFSSV